MGRYRYSLVRCVPVPATGEFINIGAIAGSSQAGDWAVRQIGNPDRAMRLCSPQQYGAVTEFIADAVLRIRAAEDSLFPLPDDWLDEMVSERRNVVQLSEPQVAVARSAQEVIDLVFANQVIDPAIKAPRNVVLKHQLMSKLREEFRRHSVAAEYIVERSVLTTGGGHITFPIDFAFGANQAVQLTQVWSFQKDSVEEVARDVKAWGYALERLREGDPSRLNAPKDKSLSLVGDVPIEVVFSAPITTPQSDVFAEATEVFTKLDATVYSDNEAPIVAEHVAKLLAA
jgi:Protein of unknown function (DUF3037)